MGHPCCGDLQHWPRWHGCLFPLAALFLPLLGCLLLPIFGAGAGREAKPDGCWVLELGAGGARHRWMKTGPRL